MKSLLKQTLLEKRKSLVLQKAQDLLQKNSSSSLEEIAHHAGVGEATVYRYFGSRGGLIKSLFEDMFGKMDIQLSHEIKENQTYTELIEALIRVSGTISSTMKLVMDDEIWMEHAPELKELHKKIQHGRLEFGELLTKVVCQGQEEGLLNTSLPPKWISMHILNSFFTALEYCTEAHISEEIVKKYLRTTLLEGIVVQHK